jgi:tetratricopeptide (TPR) repeat protein
MIERHYDDEALVTMLDSGAHASDPHVSACGECADKLDGFRLVVDALHDPATWDQREFDAAPNPHTIATLRAFAGNMAAEDAAAEAYVADLLAGPRSSWMARLAAHPEYRTAGTVRKLIAATDRALDTMPADAVEITALATDIAEHLDPAAHRPDTLARLRGGAWRERAYALFYTAQIAQAERALLIAASHLEECSLPEYEQARLSIVRALIARTVESYGQARMAARSAAATFTSFADVRRAASAQLAEAHSCYGSGDYRAAFEILSRVERQLRTSSHAETHALALGNLAFCCWKLNRIDDALNYHEAAATLLDGLGIRTESVRTRWNIASILASEGRVDEALSRLNGVVAEFRQLGMSGLATFAQLDVAELLLARGQYEDVEEICKTAMHEFASAGLEHTQRALTALALMKEAAASRTATPVLVRRVREYLHRLPAEPNLLFLPLPS